MATASACESGGPAVRLLHGPGLGAENTDRKEPPVGLVVLLLLLALLFGGLGLFVEGLKWALVIALILVVVGALSGYRGRRVV
jgi:hypothetical protein